MQPNAVVSGEGVRLALTTAGVATRTIASLIDATIQFVALLLLALLDGAVLGSADDAAASAVVLVQTVLILAGYPIVLEWTMRGRTVGKLCLGLRVVRDDGGPIGFRQALVRGLASMFVEKPGLIPLFGTIAGLTTMTVSGRDKRIGDHLAGTIVLDERAAPQALATPPNWVPLPLQGWATALDMHRLDDRLALVLRQFVSRAHAMTPAAQQAMGTDLLHRVLAVTSPPPPPGTPIPSILTSVLAERRRRTFAHAAPPAAYGAPGQTFTPQPDFARPGFAPPTGFGPQTQPPTRQPDQPLPGTSPPPDDSPFSRPF